MLTRRVFVASALAFGSTTMVAIISYLFRLMLARQFSVAEYGLIYSIVALFGIFSIIVNLGLQSALIKYIAEFKVKKKLQKIKSVFLITTYSHIIIASLVGSVFLISARQISLKYLGSEEYYVLIILYTIFFALIPLVNVIKSSFRGFFKINYYTLVEISQPTIILLVTFLLIIKGYGIKAFFISHLLFAILALVVFYFIFTKKVFPEFSKIKSKFDKQLMIKLYKFGLPLFLIGTLGIFLGRLNTVFLTILSSLEEVGLYNIAYPTARAAWRIGSAFIMILLPLISELWAKKDVEKLSKGIGTLYKYSMVLIFPLALVFFLFPQIIIILLFGEKFLGAAPTLQVFSLAMIVIIFTKINGAILPGIGRPNEIVKYNLYAGLCNIGLNIFLIPIFGSVGAALATLFSFTGLFIISTTEINKHIQLHLNWKTHIKIAVSSILVAGFISFIKSFLKLNMFLEAGILLPLIGFLYLILIVLLRIVTWREIKTIYLNIIKRSK